jgi:ribosome recycling factor
MLEEARANMQKTIDFLRGEIGQIRTGRATPALLENVLVEVYGSKMKIVELGQISAPDPKQLLISPWDKTIIGDVVKGIQNANLGLNPIAEEEAIRIHIPPLTEERRKEFIKILHQKLEMARVSVRSIRHESMSQLKRQKEAGEIGEDEEKRLEKQLQESVEEFIEEVEVLGEHKEKELMEI